MYNQNNLADLTYSSKPWLPGAQLLLNLWNLTLLYINRWSFMLLLKVMLRACDLMDFDVNQYKGEDIPLQGTITSCN